MTQHILKFVHKGKLCEEIIDETNTFYDFSFHPDYEALGEFRVGNDVYDSEVILSPRKYECIEEFYCTIVHEGIHAAIEHCGMGQIFEQKEHWLIGKMQWIDEYV